jgi:hypothetical protein
VTERHFILKLLQVLEETLSVENNMKASGVRQCAWILLSGKDVLFALLVLVATILPL